MKNLDEFANETYVRRPFQVQAFEITRDNIAELAPHVGELCDDNGNPFIKSDKKKVGNNFKVWPGFFATVLKGQVRCYSRKTFFDQFGELNEKTGPVVEFLHGRCTLDEMVWALAPATADTVLAEQPEVEVELDLEAAEEATSNPAGELEVKAEDAPTCEHGTPLGDKECVYKNCSGPVNDEDDDDDEVADEPDSYSSAEEPSLVDQYRAGLESVIKP